MNKKTIGFYFLIVVGIVLIYLYVISTIPDFKFTKEGCGIVIKYDIRGNSDIENKNFFDVGIRKENTDDKIQECLKQGRIKLDNIKKGDILGIYKFHPTCPCWKKFGEIWIE